MPPFLSYYHPSWLGPVGTTSRSVLIKTLGLILPQAFSLLRMLRPPGSPRSIDRLAIKVKLFSKALNISERQKTLLPYLLKRIESSFLLT